MRYAICLVVAICLAAPAEARRVALIIGNSGYAVRPLANPSRDARAIANAFKDTLQFDSVTLKTDLTRQGLVDALHVFESDTVGAEIAVVFLAGHGTALEQIDTYLVPIDAKLARESDLEDEAISLRSVLRRLEGASTLRLVILDACRNPPFPLAGRKRDTSRGLARVEPEDNTLIAYATKDGKTADDGAGAHSPFTAALLKHIGTRGIDVTFVFRAVRDDVMQATKREQQPHLYGTLGFKPVYLHRALAHPATAAPPAQALPTPTIEAPNEPLPTDIAIDSVILCLVRSHPFFSNAPPVFIGTFKSGWTSSGPDPAGRPLTDTVERGTKVRWLGPGIIGIERDERMEQRYSRHTSKSPWAWRNERHTSIDAANGLITLGYKSSRSQKLAAYDRQTSVIDTGGTLVGLDNLKGRVFPVRVGNRFSYEETWQTSSGKDKDKETRSYVCEVSRQYAASSFHPSLTGVAYLLVCDYQAVYQKNKDANNNGRTGQFFFEKLGIWIEADPISPRERLINEHADYTLKSFTLAR